MRAAIPWKIDAARDGRAEKLAEAVLEWKRLAGSGRFPRSLHEILHDALKREYALGYQRRRREIKR